MTVMTLDRHDTCAAAVAFQAYALDQRNKGHYATSASYEKLARIAWGALGETDLAEAALENEMADRRRMKKEAA